jgi:cysteinyl-tRNA synthetase
MLEAWKKIGSLKASAESSGEVVKVISNIEDALCDDLNTPIAIAQLFELSKMVNACADGKYPLTKEDIDQIANAVEQYFYGVLGMRAEQESQSGVLDKVMDVLIDLRSEAKQSKDYALSDSIRDKLKENGVELMDSKDGTTWKLQ